MGQENKKKVRRQAQVMREECVACGTCANVCPISAVSVIAGVFAQVDPNKCVGCAKCAGECPASVIEMIIPVEVLSNEKEDKDIVA